MVLEENQFLKSFTPQGARALVAEAKIVSFPNGKVVFEEGADSDAVFMLLEGAVVLSKKSGGVSVELAEVGPGGYFGELGVMDGSIRSATARSRGASRLARLDGRKMMKVLHSEPADTAVHIFGRVLHDLRAINNRFVTEMVRKEKLQFIGEMAGSIVHDFRNPITAIQMGARLLKNKLSDEGSRNRCEMIVQQGQRMVMMVQELLDFTKGKPSLKLEKMTVSQFFNQFRLLNEDYFRQNEVVLKVQALDDEVRLDGGRMLRVLQNLATNAIEAVKGEGAVLELSAVNVGGGVEIRFKDNGPGIPESIRENLFDAFVTHGKENGTGLGTAIARMMVEAHKGKIRFETGTGKGTTFFIWLPKV